MSLSQAAETVTRPSLLWTKYPRPRDWKHLLVAQAGNGTEYIIKYEARPPKYLRVFVVLRGKTGTNRRRRVNRLAVQTLAEAYAVAERDLVERRNAAGG
jgi:hypothetical protein